MTIVDAVEADERLAALVSAVPSRISGTEPSAAPASSPAKPSGTSRSPTARARGPLSRRASGWHRKPAKSARKITGPDQASSDSRASSRGMTAMVIPVEAQLSASARP